MYRVAFLAHLLLQPNVGTLPVAYRRLRLAASRRQFQEIQCPVLAECAEYGSGKLPVRGMPREMPVVHPKLPLATVCFRASRAADAAGDVLPTGSPARTALSAAINAVRVDTANTQTPRR
jgi:hypothetical protein